MTEKRMSCELKLECIMGKDMLTLLIFLFFFIEPTCHAQEPFVISGPRLELRDHMLHISYDIMHSEQTDEFNVSITITDEEGNKLNAISLSGDIGVRVNGGSGKKIIWDPEADSFMLNASINVKINIISNRTSEPVKTAMVYAREQAEKKAQEEEQAQEQALAERVIAAREGSEENAGLGESENVRTTPVKKKTYTRTGLVVQSLFIPGLGLSHLKGKPHWLKGVAGYGCIAGSVYLNREAIDTYKLIDDVEDYEEKNSLYEQAHQQDNISEVLAYAAIGIWVTDFIWTLVATSDHKKKSSQSEVSGFSLKTNIDPLTYAPMLGLRYRF